MSKRQRREARKEGSYIGQKTNFNLKRIQPKTDAQKDTFEAFDEGYNLVLHGYAGTGKTLISLYLALKAVLEDKEYKKVMIVRSVVPTREIGFLPGTAAEKTKVYETPYIDIVNSLFDRGDAYSTLKMKGIISFNTTSFMRGTNIKDTIVVVDEIQNMTLEELSTTVLRLTDTSKIIFSGDFRQTDLQKCKDKEGIHKFLKIVDIMDEFDYIEFEIDDIVRSGLAKSFLIAKEKIN